MKELWEIFGVRPEVSAREMDLAAIGASAAEAAIWAAWRMDDGLACRMARLAAWDAGWQMREISGDEEERFDLAAAIGDWQESLAVLLDGAAREWPVAGFDDRGAAYPAEWARVGESGAVWRESAAVGRDLWRDFGRAAAGEVAAGVTPEREAVGQPSFWVIEPERAAEWPVWPAVGDTAAGVSDDMADAARENVPPVIDEAVWRRLGGFLPEESVGAGREERVAAAAGERQRGRVADMAAGAASEPGREEMPGAAVDVEAVSRQVADILSDGLQVALGGMSLFVR